MNGDDLGSVRLLRATVERAASELHIAVGQPPVLRLDRHFVRLGTRALGADDCLALMKGITPEPNQQEIREKGRADFDFAFGDQARFRAAVFTLCEHIGMALHRIR